MKIWERIIKQKLIQNEKDGLQSGNFDENWISVIKVLGIFKVTKNYNRNVVDGKTYDTTKNVGFKK